MDTNLSRFVIILSISGPIWRSIPATLSIDLSSSLVPLLVPDQALLLQVIHFQTIDHFHDLPIRSNHLSRLLPHYAQLRCILLRGRRTNSSTSLRDWALAMSHKADTSNISADIS